MRASVLGSGSPLPFSSLTLDCAAGYALAGITSRLRFVVIRCSMDDEAATIDIVFAFPHRQSRKIDAVGRFSIGIGHQIGHITGVMFAFVTAMGLVCRVEMALGAGSIRC